MNKLLFCLLLAMPVSAQTALWIDLSGEWRVAYGDRAEYAAPGFDDSTWRTLTLPLGANILKETHCLREPIEPAWL
jgi:hypothetical protein